MNKVTHGNYILFTFVIPNIYIMKERLLEFLRNENKTSAQLAEEIGVQASGISHILSGRNNPSLDFVLKMLEKYKFLSTDWLLFGTGSMYKDSKMQNLFDESFQEKNNDKEVSAKNYVFQKESDFQDVKEIIQHNNTNNTSAKASAEVVKIVWFYDNSSFEEFFPRK
jgi:transcriptional regulator with XRE-family HTH domain